jgi:hypothetical protein
MSLFQFKYSKSNEPSIDGVICLREGELFLKIEPECSVYFSEDEFPFSLLFFDIWGNLSYSFDSLYPNSWSKYLDSYHKDVKLVTSKGRELINWKWDIYRDGDICYQVFENWAHNNQGAKGMAIGVNDGSAGEWIDSVISGRLSAVLVEPTNKTCSVLRDRFNWMKWVNIEEKVVTRFGGEVTFWEGDVSVCNSVIKEHSVGYSGDSVVEKKYDSITISDLTEKYNISGKWWLHVDVEGYDDELIYSLDDNNLPDIIVFEHVNFLEEKRSKLLKWLSDRNYRTELVYMNGVSVRN